LPGANVADACAAYADVTTRWNADQIRVLRAAAAAAATGDRAAVIAFLQSEGSRVRALDDELRAQAAAALRSIERAASRAHGRPVRPHGRGRLISAMALSVAMAACGRRPLSVSGAGRDAAGDVTMLSDAAGGEAGNGPVDAGESCPPGRMPAASFFGTCCGNG